MIRALIADDATALVALEAEVQSGARPRALARALDDEDMRVLGAWRDEALTGYALVARLPFDAELQAIGVALAWRGQGIGRTLLKGALDQARAWHSERMLLEVRANNQTAITLYAAAGFEMEGRRRNYYPATCGAGREDALLMSRAL